MLDYERLLLQLIGSLMLCDHMGDVMDDVLFVLKQLNIELEHGANNYQEAIRCVLHKREITTLYGSSLL